jgi:Tol biopolymer transport system component
MTRRLAVLGATAALASVTAVALATTPGTDGPITFRRYLNADQSRSALYMMAPDGSGVRAIARSPRRTVYDQPDWAPDGASLAFTVFPANGPAWVAQVDADGSGLHQVTPRCRRKPAPDRVPVGCEDAANVSFTPDGLHLTYSRATGRVRQFPRYEWDQIEHSAIAVIGIDGTGRRELLRLPAYAGDLEFAQVSPDGRYIAFERTNSPLVRPRLAHAVFVMNADGSGVHRVTPWSLHAGDNPDWAPDSSRILFRSKEDVDDERSQYFTVRPDGSDLTQLTHFPFAHRRLFSAAYSPDGQRIVFARADTKGRGDVWIMNADGSDPHPVLTAAPWDSAPDWGAAG